MPPQIKCKAHGDHSTPVDIGACAEILALALASCDDDGTIGVKVRRVEIARRSYPPGIHATGYEIHAPFTIEGLLFVKAPTGWPIHIQTYNAERFEKILRCLSDRLHQSWQQSIRRHHGIDMTSLGNSDRLNRRCKRSMNPRDGYRAATSGLRSMIKGDLSGTAHNLVKSLDEPGTLGEANERQISEGVQTIIPKGSDPDQAAQVLRDWVRIVFHTYEQFGFVSILHEPHAPGEAWDLELTPYCHLLSEQWIEEEKVKAALLWEAKCRVAKNKFDRATRRVQESEALLAQRQLAVAVAQQVYETVLNEDPASLAG